MQETKNEKHYYIAESLLARQLDLAENSKLVKEQTAFSIYVDKKTNSMFAANYRSPEKKPMEVFNSKKCYDMGARHAQLVFSVTVSEMKNLVKNKTFGANSEQVCAKLASKALSAEDVQILELSL